MLENSIFYLFDVLYIYIYIIIMTTIMITIIYMYMYIYICYCYYYSYIIIINMYIIYIYPHYITMSLMSFSRLKEVCAVLEGVPRFIASLPVRGAQENRRGLPQGLLTIINNHH